MLYADAEVNFVLCAEIREGFSTRSSSPHLIYADDGCDAKVSSVHFLRLRLQEPL
jgi:hypothetical protein